MNEVQIFNFKNSQVRVIELEGEPWFVGKDVATVLGYKNTRDAMNKHVDTEDNNIPHLCGAKRIIRGPFFS